MKRVLVSSLSLIFVLALTAFAVAAQESGQQSGAMKKVEGKITALDDKSITVETTQAGKTENLTFMLNPDTKKPADLAVGSEVIVEWKEEAGKKIAITIIAKGAKHHQ